MFVIFGWGRRTLKNHGQIYSVRCGTCNSVEQFSLFTKRTWFTLFFIPIIPYKTEHMLLCPVCSNGMLIDHNQFEEYKYIVRCNADLENQRITAVEYEEKIKDLDNKYRFDNKTDVGRNYLKCIEEFERQKAQMNSMPAE